LGKWLKGEHLGLRETFTIDGVTRSKFAGTWPSRKRDGEKFQPQSYVESMNQLVNHETPAYDDPATENIPETAPSA
jgi:hypothetical protein